MADTFSKPNRMAADVVLDVTERLDSILAMLACHRSQVFEWLPYEEGLLDEVPADDNDKLVWLRGWYLKHSRRRAEWFRRELIAAFGRQRGAEIEAVEVYEISEYASRPEGAERQRLFPAARFLEHSVDATHLDSGAKS